MISGVYHLLLRLGRPRRIRVGALGLLPFPAGYYTYTGRAMRGLGARLARHSRRGGKRLRWHIDYLRRAAALEAIRLVAADEAEAECRLALDLLAQARRRLGAGALLHPGFGASDCRCPAHLVHWGERPPGMRGPAWGRPVRLPYHSLEDPP
ncbi:MAG: GIY-YIG nuclease family protein [bacterium]